jgi:hypothetical protein
MFVVACAQQLRGQARQALCAGRYHEARALAGQAQDLHRTAFGQKIAALAALCEAACRQP